MLSSNHINQSSQAIFREKYSFFLEQLEEKEHWPENCKGGVCSALSFMLFRDDLIANGKNVASRLFHFLQKKPTEILGDAAIFNLYQQKLKKAIAANLAALKTKLAATNTTDTKQQQAIRDQHYQALKKQILKNFSPDHQQLIIFYDDLYFFVNAMLFSHSPGYGGLGLQRKNMPFSQNDYLHLLAFLAPDEWIKNGKVQLPVQHAFSFVFDFREKELIDYANKIFCDGDYVRIASTEHTMFFKKQNGLFYFFDPNGFNLNADNLLTPGLTLQELVNALKIGFYENLGYTTTHFILSMDIYEHKDKPNPRPKPRALFKELMRKRRTNKDINGATYDHATTLWLAATDGHMGLAKSLLLNQADPNIPRNTGSTPLIMAAETGNIEVVNLLLKHKANIEHTNAKGYNALHAAVIQNNLALATTLINQGSKMNIHTNNPFLWLAAFYGHLEIAALLLKHQADVNTASLAIHSTPLYVAAQNGYVEIVDLLLQNNADVNELTSDGCSPLLVAVAHGRLEIVKKLIASGADVNQVNIDKVAPLYAAASKGEGEMVALLLAHAAEVDVLNIYHNSPLHAAINANTNEVVKLLIKANANLHEQNNDALTPLAMAIKNQKWDIAILLLLAIPKNDMQILKPLLSELQIAQPHLIKALEKYFNELPTLEKNSLTMSDLKSQGAVSLLFPLMQNKAPIFANTKLPVPPNLINPLAPLMSPISVPS